MGEYDKTILDKEYILLDWNVIKYLKTYRNSNDKQCLQLIKHMYSRYEFPFCESHLRDLARSFSEDNRQLIEADLDFLTAISRSVAVGENSKTKKLCLCTNNNPKTLFDDIRNEVSYSPNIRPEMNPREIFKVDMQKLDTNHPMREMLEKSGGIYTPDIMADFLNGLYKTIFSDQQKYKDIRNQATHIKLDLKKNCGYILPCDKALFDNLYTHAMPFLESLEITDEDKLASVWKDVVREWLQINLDSNVPEGELITTAYSMLDYHPLFREKLKKGKNTLSNIIRDSKMIYYASSSKYFVSEDKACLKKASFIFKAFQYKTKVIDIDQFVQIFS